MRAFEEPGKDNRLNFWNQPDLKLSTCKIRLTFNRIVGEYELHIVNPVSAEISEKHKGELCINFAKTSGKNL